MSVRPLPELMNEVYASPDARFAYDGSNDVEYIGKNDTLGASIDRADWTITKLTYSGVGVNKVITRIQKQVGAWSGRASLDWS